MVVVSDDEGRVLSHLLTIVRYRTSWIPPFLFIHASILGEGVYTPLSAELGLARDELFGEMLTAITDKLNRQLFYIEVSHLSQKMFAYRQFRKRGYFPVKWMSIHNSLHSHNPEERLSERMLSRIEGIEASGVATHEVTTEAELQQFSRLLRKHNMLKPKRYIPDDQFFRCIMNSNDGRLFLTVYHGHVIGCSACVYSQNNVYLWYSAYKRKTYLRQHPDEMTVWHTIKDAHRRGYDHIFFMDVGLPFSRNPYREFILSFGGKPVATYRWFRFSIRWVNTLLNRLFRD